MSTHQAQNHKRIITITTIAVIGLFVIIPIVIFIINSTKTATLKTIIAPSFATITIDGKTHTTNSEIKFAPTTTKATISAKGFQSQEIDLDLRAHETTTIALYLLPEDGDLSWYYQNPNEQRFFSSVTDYQALQSANAYRAKYPISEILPINIVDTNPPSYQLKEYRIDIGQFAGCKSDFCLKITDRTGGNEAEALEQIRFKGFNPDDYEIIYSYEPYFTGPPARAD